jgi:hypothetical protein
MRRRQATAPGELGGSGHDHHSLTSERLVRVRRRLLRTRLSRKPGIALAVCAPPTTVCLRPLRTECGTEPALPSLPCQLQQRVTLRDSLGLKEAARHHSHRRERKRPGMTVALDVGACRVVREAEGYTSWRVGIQIEALRRLAGHFRVLSPAHGGRVRRRLQRVESLCRFGRPSGAHQSAALLPSYR